MSGGGSLRNRRREVRQLGDEQAFVLRFQRAQVEMIRVVVQASDHWRGQGAEGGFEGAQGVSTALAGETFAAQDEGGRRQAFGGQGAAADLGVVCGRGRNPTLRLWPAIFSGEIDVFPSERRNMGQEIGR